MKETARIWLNWVNEKVVAADAWLTEKPTRFDVWLCALTVCNVVLTCQ